MSVHTDAWDRVLRAHGYRITPQRQLVLQAITSLHHSTPDQILAEVQRTARGVNLSTVYRTIDVLESVGLVTHAHIDHGPPTYHPVEDEAHIHLVCDRCDRVESVSADLAASFAALLEREVGFRTDLSHVSVHGLCRECARDGAQEARGASGGK